MRLKAIAVVGTGLVGLCGCFTGATALKDAIEAAPTITNPALSSRAACPALVPSYGPFPANYSNYQYRLSGYSASKICFDIESKLDPSFLNSGPYELFTLRTENSVQKESEKLTAEPRLLKSGATHDLTGQPHFLHRWDCCFSNPTIVARESEYLVLRRGDSEVGVWKLQPAE